MALAGSTEGGVQDGSSDSSPSEDSADEEAADHQVEERAVERVLGKWDAGASGTLQAAPILQACCGVRSDRLWQPRGDWVAPAHRLGHQLRPQASHRLQCPRQSCFYTFERHRE